MSPIRLDEEEQSRNRNNVNVISASAIHGYW